MRKERLLRRIGVVKTDPACAFHVLHALLRPLAKERQAKVRVRHEAGALLLRAALHALAAKLAHRAVRALKNRVFARAEMLGADRKHARAPVRLAENLRSILCRRAAMPRGSGYRHVLLQRSRLVHFFQKTPNVHLRALLVLRRSCARLGALRYQKMNPEKKLLRHQRTRVLAGKLRSLLAALVRKASVVRRQARRTMCLGENRGFPIMC